jgi:hypothetical protein
MELAYHAEKLLIEARPDRAQINSLLGLMRKPPEAVRDRLLYEQVERRLDVIGDHDFQKVIEKLTPYQAHILTTMREQAKERERLADIEKERTHTIERSR